MITLYHTPISLNSRRVWVTLLEKGLSFDLVKVNLTGGEQYQPEFLAMNPFHHIPVLVDDETTVIESFAILDYLEAKYPTPALLPKEANAIAKVRMVQMVVLNELTTALGPLTRQFMGFGEASPEELDKAKQQVAVSLKFFESKLGDQTFFGGEQLTLADIVLGIITPWFDELALPLADYPGLQAWTARLMERPAWKTTQATPEEIEAFKVRAREMMARRR
ncbi:glutathione S-transferase family protein [Pseudanabaena sp. FACHB-2040]|uniref:glutathione S-transferase family protein n=1 Tax=Pseudanabaena sp. FACHB-2040 TaxID=2692859 RepID=UPI001689B940|nr:glutathione S-transferase family protein [Pseudanabaena sp. FACHB-2040]MBD2257261.1 glutathione S-transferase family protein [Pseudanabaena sp. FACHB-2040]